MMMRQTKATEGRRVIALCARARCRYTVVTMKEIWDVTSPISRASRTAGTSVTVAQETTPLEPGSPRHPSLQPHPPAQGVNSRQDVRLLATIRYEVLL